MKENESQENPSKKLFGLDPEMSLLSVNFATGENPFLNEHYQEDTNENQDK